MNQSDLELALIAYDAYCTAYRKEHGLAHVYPEFQHLSHSKKRIWEYVAITVKAKVLWLPPEETEIDNA